ncbi:MAG TPA: peptide chain release factor 1 [Leptolyngbyaceae cyanobacterium M65_K2018_010]|nr:peptide chain release factor 1 [Leptolyngbyaceae cyanobacterium M65_K2018_010]
MRNPFWRLKTLPWGPLLGASALGVAIAAVADIFLGAALIWLMGSLSGALMPFFQILLIGLPVAAGFGVGALALVMMERTFSHIYLETGVLWALIACLGLVLFLKSWLPFPSALVTFGYSQMVGVLLGVFLTGKRHWR